MSELSDLERTWEIYGRADPMWAALMDPDKRGGKWDAEAFFATGEAEIATVFAYLDRQGVTSDPSGEALDFGCGVGRLTQALARRFTAVCGVDISAAMVERATAFNRYPERCRYVVNSDEHLAPLASDSFAFIYTSIVLQHMQPTLSLGYLAEFARVLKPGGVLVFQLPEKLNRGRRPVERLRTTADELRRALRIRMRAYQLMRRARLLRDPPRVYEAAPEMHCIPEVRVAEELRARGLELIDVQLTNSTDLGFVGALRYLEREPTVGYVSKQYCAVKPPGPQL
jgi:SAM-dependent methyltransferase